MSVLLSLTLIITLTSFFFFNDTATTEIYTLSLHDALPIYRQDFGSGERREDDRARREASPRATHDRPACQSNRSRSEEHTSELQSHSDLVCRLLLEKKKKKKKTHIHQSKQR